MSSWTEPWRGPLPRASVRVADYLAWRPEWPAVVVVALAWGWLALPGGHPHVVSSGAAAVGHAHGAAAAPLMSATTWAAMCVAMMLPLALPALRHVAHNSMPGRRWTGMGLFATGYVVPWLLLGAVVLPVAGAVVADDGTSLPLATMALAVAAAWQVTPFKRWAVLSCSRTVPLAPYGPRAWWARVEFGLRQALRCAAACWPLMLLMAVLPHGLPGVVLMALLTGVMLVEMQWRLRRRVLPWIAVPLGVAAVVTGVLAA